MGGHSGSSRLGRWAAKCSSKKQGCVAAGLQEGEEPVAVRMFLPAFACESSFPKEGEGRGCSLEL